MFQLMYFFLELDISMKVDSSSFGLYILVTEKKAQLMKKLILIVHNNCERSGNAIFLFCDLNITSFFVL